MRWILDSRHYIPDALSADFGLNCYCWRDSGLLDLNSGFQNLDYLTWGDLDLFVFPIWIIIRFWETAHLPLL